MSRPTQGNSEILFVRATPSLIEALDREVERRRKKRPGEVISRASVARTLIWAGLGRGLELAPKGAA